MVRGWADKNCGGVRKLKLDFGVGCHNMVVMLNDEHVFKIPLLKRENPGPREKRIVDAMRTVSPIYFPEMEIMNWDGVLVRRYEFIHGKLLCDLMQNTLLPTVPRLHTNWPNLCTKSAALISQKFVI